MTIDFLSLTGTASEGLRISPGVYAQERETPVSGPSFQEILEQQKENRQADSQKSDIKEKQAADEQSRFREAAALEKKENSKSLDKSESKIEKNAVDEDKNSRAPDKSGIKEEPKNGVDAGKSSGTSAGKLPDSSSLLTNLAEKKGENIPDLKAADLARKLKTSKNAEDAADPVEKTRTDLSSDSMKEGRGSISGSMLASMDGNLKTQDGRISGKEGKDSASLLKEAAGEKNNAGRLGGEKSRVAGADRIQDRQGGIELTLVDLRREKPSGNPLEKARDRKIGGDVKSLKNSIKISGSGEESSGSENTGKGMPFRVIELTSSAAPRGDVNPLTGGKDDPAGKTEFHKMLKDEGIPKIVKQSGILLKDNNQGEIKLVLQPESLGKVRIRLNLQENNIAGRIFVENSSVKDAFNGALDELAKALRDSGFDTAQLEVSVEGQGRDEGQQRQKHQAGIRKSVIAALEESASKVKSYYEEDILVNLLA